MNMLTSYSEKFLPLIEAELRKVVGISLQPGLEENYAMLAYHMGWDGNNVVSTQHGKRVRPLIVLLVTDAAGGNWNCALPAAAAVELVHNFSLIHDDIQDQSALRRGRESVWKRWGVAQAINAGDAMFTLAHISILRLNETSSIEVALRASRILQETCLALTQGQYLDLSYEGQDQLQVNAYWPMVEGKTAALLSTSAAIGAIVAEAEDEVVQKYQRFAGKLGLAFQVLDDILGIWGDDRLMGKSSQSDLVSGKKSLPVLFALEKDGEFARRWKQGPIKPQEVPEMTALLESEGGLEYARSHANSLSREALESLRQANPIESARMALEELTALLLSRKL